MNGIRIDLKMQVTVWFILLFFVLSLPKAFAHNDASRNLFEMSLEELMNIEVVSDAASMFNEDELRVGSSVASIPAKKWEQAGIRRTFDVMELAGFVKPYANLAGAPIFVSRGYHATTGHAVLLDGIPLQVTSSRTAAFEIPNWELGTLDRIEVVKGPVSAIYGSDAFHSVISMKTFESDSDTTQIAASSAYPLYGDANLKLSRGYQNNRTRVDASASASGQGDMDMEYQWEEPLLNKSGTGEYENRFDSQSGVFKVRYIPAEKLEAKFGAYFGNFEGRDFPSGYTANGISLQDFDFSSADSFFYMGSGLISYTFDNQVSLETKVHYWQTDRDASYGASPGDDDFIMLMPSYPGKTQYVTREINSQSGVEIMLKQPGNAYNLQWALATSYVEGQVSDTESRIESCNSGLAILDNGEMPYEDFKQEIKSVFGQLRWGVIKDRLYLLSGCRLDNYDTFGDQLTPRGGVIFLPTENSSIKALYGNAFIAPSAVNFYGNGLAFSGDLNLKPEEIDVYELAYIYQRDNWKLNVTGFHSVWENEVQLIADSYVPPGFTQRFENQGKNEATGIETSFFYRWDPFSVNIGYAYVESKALDVPLDPADINGAKEDQKISSYPDHVISFELYYTYPPANIEIYLNNRIYLDMTEVTHEIDPHAERLPAYWRMDLSLTKKISSACELSLCFGNLLDRENRLPSRWGVINGTEDPGINAMLRMRYQI